MSFVIIHVISLFIVFSPASAAKQSTVAELVAAARKALGGEEALGKITSLTIRGIVERNQGTTLDWQFETSYELPDKFLRISRRTFDRPTRYDVTQYEGFNGSDVIIDNVAPKAPNRIVVPPLAPPRNAQEAEAAALRRLRSMHQMFFEAILPLFVTLPSTYGLEPHAVGREPLAQGTADVIELRRSDGMTWLLFLDVATHLPVQLTWKARPNFIVSVPSSSGMQPGTGARDPRQAPEVFWVLQIRDYRKSENLTWPRRLTTLSDGKPFSDVRVSTYQINPKIDPKVFEPRK